MIVYGTTFFFKSFTMLRNNENIYFYIHPVGISKLIFALILKKKFKNIFHNL